MQFTNEAMGGGLGGEQETRTTDRLAVCPLFQYCTYKFYNISLPEKFFDRGNIKYNLHCNA